MKNIITLIVSFLVFNLGYGQTTLAAGEIAITGFNSDTPDQFAFVLLTDITTTTEIKFTDNGQQTINYNVTDEGIITWTATTNLTCGTEIIIEDTGGNTYSATFGTATETGLGFALATLGDQILAYQGPDITPTFIYAITFDSTGWFDADNAQTTTLPAGLTDGANAVNLGEADNAIYNCTFNNNESLILAGISNTVYWTTTDGFGNESLTLGGCGYTCAPCLTTVTWDGVSWSAPPGLTTSAIINANYNTTANGSFSACSLTVNDTFRLTVDNSTYVEVESNVIVNGELYVETQGAFVQNDATGAFTVNATTGTALVNKTTTTLISWLEYTYWSSPVEDDTVENVFGNVPSNRRFLFNATNFVDLFAEIGNTGFFDPVPDDIDDGAPFDWQIASGTLLPGIGYAATGSQLGFFPASQQFTFRGAFNNGIIQSAIVNNSGGLYNDWNFIGNPYPGAIDTNVFFSVNSGIIDDVIYLWSQATPANANASGNEGSNFSNADYAMITGSGVNTAGGDITLIPNDYVPSGQGFFVEALAAGNVTFNNSMRVRGASDNSQFFRTSGNKNVIWVNLTSDNGIANQLAIAYIDGATNANDGSYFDAKRNLSGGNAAIIYSIIDGDDGKFAIQGKNVNSLDIDEVVPLGFKTNIEVATLYKFSIAQLEGEFLNNNTIYLKDNLLNILHDLSLNDYTFTSEVGEFIHRFEIVFNENALSLEEHTINNNSLSIIELSNGNVQFKLSSSLEFKSIEIIDLLGRTLYRFEANGNSKTYNLSNLSQATYIAKVELSNGVVITKKAVKRK
jgi:hypothetical protein